MQLKVGCLFLLKIKPNNMNELINAAKDEAAREFTFPNFDYIKNLSLSGKVTIESLDIIYTRAMEIYAEKSATVIADKVFKMANDLAIAGHGDYAVKLHGIHNELIKTTKP